MKAFNRILVGVLIVYGILAAVIFARFAQMPEGEELAYKVEINELMQAMQQAGGFSAPDLSGMQYVKEVSFLETGAEIGEFYENKNGQNSYICPLILNDEVAGYVRFDYTVKQSTGRLLWMMQAILLLSCLFVVVVLLYIKYKIIKPFGVLSDMPYELAKGNLQSNLEENKGRFFGKFVWGIGMLRDTLSEAKTKELKLEKEKKLLLLSLSHDTKIPLSTIKLYVKALDEGLYKTEKEKKQALRQIQTHIARMEELVGEIMTASSEDILSVEVNNSEFYLHDYVEKIRATYGAKCSLNRIAFSVGEYENKLLYGDFDRAFEVMQNLMENAFKYSDGKQIALSFSEEEDCQLVKVYSSGNPVSFEEMPHLFDSFYRGSNVGGKDGNGLGLYMNRQIMKKMDGDIFAERVDDKPGAGEAGDELSVRVSSDAVSAADGEGMCFTLVFRM